VHNSYPREGRSVRRTGDKDFQVQGVTLQLATITGLEAEEELPQILKNLSSFIELHNKGYILFHRSLFDWLSGWDEELDQPQAGDFYISLKRGYEQWATFFWSLYISGQLTYLILRYLPIYLARAQHWDDLSELLSDLKYIEICSSEGLIHNLIKNYLDVLASEDIPDKDRKKIQEFKKFVVNQAHILRKYPQLTIQQAINQPDSTLPSQAGKDFMKITDFSRLWIEWINKPQERNPCILTFTGHSHRVYGCAFSPDGTKCGNQCRDQDLYRTFSLGG